MEHFFPKIQVKTKQKKGLHKKWKTFFPEFRLRPKKKGLRQKWNNFSLNSSGHLCSDAHQSQIIGGDADVYHTQTIGGDTVKLLGDISPISPGFRHPWTKVNFVLIAKENCNWNQPHFPCLYISLFNIAISKHFACNYRLLLPSTHFLSKTLKIYPRYNLE